MSISASAVKELRTRTGAGMMDCKKALLETEGDLEKAIEYLQVKGIAKAAKKADRVAAEGLVGAWVSEDGTTGAVVEVNCETDFVARNDEFVAFVNALATHVGSNEFADNDALFASSLNGTTIENLQKSKIASIGENISIRRFERVSVDQGVVATYIHDGGKIGALVVLSADGDVDANGPAADAARDIAMHVAAMNPRYATTAEIDEDTIERERRVLTDQALESGKPKEIVDKMIVGRLAKWKKEISLADQPFVKDPDITVAGLVKNVGKEIGTALSLASFVRFERGEGIEKVESNLADEVAAQLK